jgi:hypothetical protein
MWSAVENPGLIPGFRQLPGQDGPGKAGAHDCDSSHSYTWMIVAKLPHDKCGNY